MDQRPARVQTTMGCYGATAATAFRDRRSLAQTEKPSRGLEFQRVRPLFTPSASGGDFQSGDGDLTLILSHSRGQVNGMCIRVVFETTLSAFSADCYANGRMAIVASSRTEAPGSGNGWPSRAMAGLRPSHNGHGHRPARAKKTGGTCGETTAGDGAGRGLFSWVHSKLVSASLAEHPERRAAARSRRVRSGLSTKTASFDYARRGLWVTQVCECRAPCSAHAKRAHN